MRCVFFLILTSRLIFSGHQPLDPLTKAYILHSTGPSSPLPVFSLLFCDCQISRGLRRAYLHMMKGVSFVNGAPISWRNTLDTSFAKTLHAVQSSGPFITGLAKINHNFKHGRCDAFKCLVFKKKSVEVFSVQPIVKY